MAASSGRRASALYLRNFVFGVEDSLVSTVGLVSGVAISGLPRAAIFMTGIILIFVEAFSMAIGSFLSEGSVEDYLGQKNESRKLSYIAGIIMFVSYFISGFVPLFPYLFFEVSGALTLSIVVSLIALFFMGVAKGKMSHTPWIRSGFKMFLVGGIAIAVGVTIGSLVRL